ncbi:hypothetical protein GCM10027037_03160 [Mucilaginibacter koreensis]
MFLLALLAACSPKRQPVSNRPIQAQTQTSSKPAASKPTENKPVKVRNEKFSSIALLLPFELDHLNSARGLSKAQQRMANLSIDYYQGFKLALDSITADGHNYTLRAFDSKDEPLQARALAINPAIRNSNLIVGPVFPEVLKAFTTLPAMQNKPIVSPLAPTSPAIYHNKGLITVAPPLDYHAQTTAKYLSRNLGAKQVIILRSGYTNDNKYIIPFKRMIDSIGRKRIKVIDFGVVRGNLSALLPKLSRTAENYFVVPSTNQAFLMVTLHSLDTLTQHYPVVLFGHPNWIKYSFLKAERLQRLKTHITSAERIDYRSTGAITFIHNYRNTYHHDPTEYAFKGFDEGLYFGRVLADDDNNLSQLNKQEFTGLHNSFSFEFKPGQGWINTHVNLFKYVNFELKQVE